ncbi:RNA polymerase I-specific transcription initiation factor-domain-containing protein [Colletotrichum phormii]|uniref:RNA polymerase I-specific transcription initiation factor-domain-containing protein n=1 Tax=Colletotrichum phormii TaxID=359342 RepID=A0AAI9ZHZ9_9PEZI|nr:RNA polymerase I-specific transcription initiation factor-domain-containing protein [Colletotrichum phormii]KAK1624920.1 RNA polymerase I-specific transcription initiation factor-domain-containing protein [Colletotrichum phormii]
MTANEESWDLDTDEIRSVDSEELYETRPNRWKGNKATWSSYTQEERLLHRSMEKLRNRDLSVHLYNAFALRNRAVRPSVAAEPDEADTDRPLEEIVDSGEWRPPNLWTAWPMNSRIVPGDDFLKETHDEDDDFTTRSRKEELPSTALEEEMTATILRQAKERFLRRQRKAQERDQTARTRDESAHERTAASSMSALSSAASDNDDDDKEEGGENAPSPSGQGAQAGVSDVEVENPKRSKTYEPVVSANDDLSANLLRPSVRHILSTLDNTLTALHNCRLAGLSYMTDSSASATDVEDASDAASVSSAASRASSSASKRKKKGRPRSKAPRTPEPEWTRALERRGRPKKMAVPLPGETEKEMKIRIARSQKKRIPFSSDEEEDAAAGETEAEDGVKKAKGSGDETSRSRSPRKKRDLPAEARAEAKIKARETMLGNWGLRDWSDVIGAASLSGFKPDVVARAAQRCADLFGQGMEMQTLFEGSASKGPKPQTTRYIPGVGSSSTNRRGGRAGPYAAAAESSSEESEKERPVARTRRFGTSSRQNSLARDSIPPSDSDAAARGRSTAASAAAAAAAARRSRSASRASSVGLFFCPVAGCDRSLEGFGRRANLQRHVATMHPGRAGDIGGGGGSDRFNVESEEEMDGAVHVDGFLKPIRPRKGWRAEDMGKRKRKRHYRGRKMGGSDGGSGVEEAVLDST